MKIDPVAYNLTQDKDRWRSVRRAARSSQSVSRWANAFSFQSTVAVQARWAQDLPFRQFEWISISRSFDGHKEIVLVAITTSLHFRCRSPTIIICYRESLILYLFSQVSSSPVIPASNNTKLLGKDQNF